MADFNKAIDVILKHEGGWVNDPDDPGGATNYGVSLRFVQQDMAKQGEDPAEYDFNHDGIVDWHDIKDMSVEDAKAVYLREFWEPYSYSYIQDQTVATKIFDMHVNMGSYQAGLLAQRALDGKTKVDGAVGPATRLAINNTEPQYYLKRLVEEQQKFYVALASQKPKLAKFLPGWLHRSKWPF